MDVDNYTKHDIINRLVWLAIFMGIGIVLVFLLPFPFDLISISGLFILMSYLRMRSITKRYGIGGVKNFFGSVSSSISGNQNIPLKYYCMSCGKEHKEVSCPSCGSKMKRVG